MYYDFPLLLNCIVLLEMILNQSAFILPFIQQINDQCLSYLDSGLQTIFKIYSQVYLEQMTPLSQSGNERLFSKINNILAILCDITSQNIQFYDKLQSTNVKFQENLTQMTQNVSFIGQKVPVIAYVNYAGDEFNQGKQQYYEIYKNSQVEEFINTIVNDFDFQQNEFSLFFQKVKKNGQELRTEIIDQISFEACFNNAIKKQQKENVSGKLVTDIELVLKYNSSLTQQQQYYNSFNPQLAPYYTQAPIHYNHTQPVNGPPLQNQHQPYQTYYPNIAQPVNQPYQTYQPIPQQYQAPNQFSTQFPQLQQYYHTGVPRSPSPFRRLQANATNQYRPQNHNQNRGTIRNVTNDRRQNSNEGNNQNNRNNQQNMMQSQPLNRPQYQNQHHSQFNTNFQQQQQQQQQQYQPQSQQSNQTFGHGNNYNSQNPNNNNNYRNQHNSN